MKTMKNALLCSVPLALVVLACVGAPPELTAEQAAAASEYVLAEAPSPQHALDIRYESRIRLVGYDVSVEAVTPGQAFDITWYWHVERRLAGEWMLFTHIADAADSNRCNADHGSPPEGSACRVQAPLRDHLQPTYWAEGSWVRDPLHITVPADWHSDQVVFYVGFWSGDHRLSITTGPNDGDSRGRAAVLPISGGARTRAALTVRGPHRG